MGFNSGFKGLMTTKQTTELPTECILDKIDEYRRNWILHLQRMPPNRISLKSYHDSIRKHIPAKYLCLATTIHGITLTAKVILTCNNYKIYKNIKKRPTKHRTYWVMTDQTIMVKLWLLPISKVYQCVFTINLQQLV